MEFGSRLPQVNGFLPGPKSAAWIDTLARTECPSLTTRRARRAELAGADNDPIVWFEARGSNVVDVDGNVFVDMTSGFGAAAIGHGHARVRNAVTQQADRLLHALGDVHPSLPKLELLERLVSLSPWDDARVILGLSGSDAIEAALKTALLATGRPGVLAFHGGYHGLSHGPLAACGYKEVFRTPFEAQLNPHVVFAPFPRGVGAEVSDSRGAIAAVTRAWDRVGDTIGAVLVEPVLGRGGVVAPPSGFLRDLRTLCSERGALLIADEVFTGLGRCGATWRSVAEGCVPDLLCVGKALGGGFPVSACVGTTPIMQAWGTSEGEAIHTGTFVGQPVGCAAAIAALDVLRDEKLDEQAVVKGQRLHESIASLVATRTVIRDVRSVGLMVGVELDRGERTLLLLRKLLDKGYIALAAGRKAEVLSLTPPLTIENSQLDAFVHALDAALGDVT